jgi:ATP-dependent DNA ligase
VKWDGYRVIAVKDAALVRLLSRNAKDLTRDFPPVRGRIIINAKGAILLSALAILKWQSSRQAQAL